MNSQTIEKPKLDPSFYELSLPWTLFNISYGLVLFFLFGWLNYEVALSSWTILQKLIVMMPVTLISATGLYVLAALGHESLHGNLCENDKLSFLIGLFFSSSVISYFDMGFAIRHWDHHRYTNQAKDPDLIPTAHLSSWFPRLMLSRLIYNLVYIKNTFMVAAGKLNYVEQYQTPYSPEDMKFFSRANILFATIWLAFYAGIALYDWRLALYAIVIPSLLLALLAGCQSYLDHAGLGDDPFANSYIRTSPFMWLMYFGSNYHLEHHLYPKVPCYRLHKVHKFLIEQGYYDQIKPAIIPGFFAAYKTMNLKNVSHAKGS